MGPYNNLILVTRKGLTLAGASCALGKMPPWKPRNPESLDISWRDQAALGHVRSFAWLSAGSDLCLCQGMCHTPITLPPLNLPQSICSALSQVVSSPYLLARQVRSSGSVQPVPSFLVLGRGNFSLMTQGKSRTCISGALIPLSLSFSLYIWLILCQETWLLACTSLFWGFCIRPFRPFVLLLSSKG